MLLPNLPYKLADVCRDPNEWYVYYSYRHPVTQKFERFKESKYLNKKENIPHREKIAEIIVETINKELKRGFNPFETEKVRKKYGLPLLEDANQEPFKEIVTNTELEESSLSAIKQESNLPSVTKDKLARYQVNEIVNAWKKTESDPTNDTYKQMNNRFKKFLNTTCNLNIKSSEIDIDFAYDFRLFMMSHMKLKPKTVNTTLSHVGMFFDELKRRKLVTNNPFRETEHVTKKSYRGIDIDLDTEEDDYIPFTTEELEIIFTYLGQYSRNLLRFYSLVYWGFMRIVEITRLQISDIDLKSGTIRVKGPDAKNKTAAFIQILPPMRILLEEMNLNKYPSDYYVFTTSNFIPGPEKYSANAAANRWKNVVYEKLNIRKKPYSLKHTGNIHHILLNKGKVDREWMKSQNRHKTRAQLDKYIERLNIYIIDETQFNFPSEHLIKNQNKPNTTTQFPNVY
jgi:integrase